MIATLTAVLAFALALFAYATVRWVEESQRIDHDLKCLLLAQEFCAELGEETSRWGS